MMPNGDPQEKSSLLMTNGDPEEMIFLSHTHDGVLYYLLSEWYKTVATLGTCKISIFIS